MREYLDVVNENDMPIGRAERMWFYDNGVHFYRVINVFCTNMDGDILIQKKAASCKQFAGLYDFSVGGHVKSGESYEEAACREIHEEIGLEVSHIDLEEIAYLKYPNDLHTSSFSKLYHLSIGNFKPLLSEESESFDYYSEDRIRMLMKTAPFKSDFEALFNLYCAWRKENE